MNKRKISILVLLVIMSVLVSFAGGLAFADNGLRNKPADGTPLTPKLAAKREMVRKQQEQRVTNDKRKKAAEALKAERLRVYNARQAVKQQSPASIDNK